MTQLFNISIDSVDITNDHDSSQISEEMNRFYDVATVVIKDNDSDLLEKSIVINYGDKSFVGFVYSTSKLAKGMIALNCRTNSAKLTEPYSSYQEVYDDATTSHTLCALYASRSGIPINISAIDLDFGGSYERKGTMVSALTNIANVTGAEFYDNGSGITIEPNKPIVGVGVPVLDSDIFDFVPDSKTVYNKGIGFITIQNGGSDSGGQQEIISNNSIHAEIDECTGQTWLYPNPNGTFTNTVGLGSLTATQVDRKEDTGLLDQDTFILKGAIASISSVTINGANTSDYNYTVGHNVIYFNTLQRGALSVTYSAYAYRSYANIESTPSGRFISFDAFYLDQKYSYQGLLSANCSDSGGGDDVFSDGDMTVITNTLNYVQGFNVVIIGGDPTIDFFNHNEPLGRPTVCGNIDYVLAENASLEPLGADFIYRTSYPIKNVVEVRSAGTTVSYTTGSDAQGDYIILANNYPITVVSYTVIALNCYVQFPMIDESDVSMVVTNQNTGESSSYDLLGIDYDDINAIPCVLNQDVPINLANELSLSITDITGVSISYLKPNNTTGSAAIDSFGIIKIYVFMDGDYVLDTSPIAPRTTVTLTSNVNG